MTAGSLLTILFYLWLVITAVLAVMWYRRRVRRKAEAKAKARPMTPRQRQGETETVDTSSTSVNPSAVTVSSAAVTPSAVTVSSAAATAPSAAVAAASDNAAVNGVVGMHVVDNEDPTIDAPINLADLLTPDGDATTHTNGAMTEAHQGEYSPVSEDLDDGLTVRHRNEDDGTTESSGSEPSAGDVDPAQNGDGQVDGSDVVGSNAVTGDLNQNDAVTGDLNQNDAVTGDVNQNDAVASDLNQNDAVTSDVSRDDAVADDGDGSSGPETGSGSGAEEPVVLGVQPADDDTSTHLVRVLSEFNLPYDLRPLGGGKVAEQVQNGHITLVSEHAEAADIGTALADRLVERGYEFEPIGHDRGLAKRDGDVVGLRIIPDITDPGVEDRYRASGLTDSTVVVEMWCGHSGLDEALAAVRR